MTATVPTPSLMAISPVIALACAVILILLAAVLRPAGGSPVFPVLAVLGIAAAAVLTALQLRQASVTTFSGMWRADAFSAVTGLAVLSAGVLTVLVGDEWLRRGGHGQPEFYSIMLSAMVGMLVTASATDLVTLFLGIELTSLPTYVLTGFAKRRRESNEGAIKYFLLGAFSTAVLLYGLVWLFARVGSTGYERIAAAAAVVPAGDTVLLLGILLVIAGMGFKMAAVPFHAWAPDAYDGAPTVVTAFMSVAVKAAAFAGLARLLSEALGAAWAQWTPVLAVLAVVTMTFGNLVAVTQRNLKRMLAYSSIGHTGFMLAGLASWRPDNSAGVSSVLFYAVAYVSMNVGAFAALSFVERRDGLVDIDSVNGLFMRSRLVSVVLAVSMLGLMGFPLTVGLPAKVFVFEAALRGGNVWLAVSVALASVVGAAYYLRVLVRMFMYGPADSETRRPRPILAAGLLAAAVMTVVLGFAFAPVLTLAERAAGG